MLGGRAGCRFGLAAPAELVGLPLHHKEASAVVGERGQTAVEVAAGHLEAATENN